MTKAGKVTKVSSRDVTPQAGTLLSHVMITGSTLEKFPQAESPIPLSYEKSSASLALLDNIWEAEPARGLV